MPETAENDEQERRIRILLAKPGLDAHIRGMHVLSKAFRDAGFEVVYLGLYQTPELVVEAAVAEDVDVVALSSHGGSHLAQFTRVAELLGERGMSHICVVGGGVIPEDDKPKLEAAGVTGNFGPGTLLPVIIQHIKDRVAEARTRYPRASV